MGDQFVLEIEWHGWKGTGPPPRLVGPFGSQLEAEEFAGLNVRNGTWLVTQLQLPYLR